MSTALGAGGVYTYDAFISHSHAADAGLARRINSALQKLTKPWYRRRALHLFLDDAALAVTPALQQTIYAALSQSRFLILLASPLAAQSEWVSRELGYWLDQQRELGTLLVVLTDGHIIWDHAAGDFDWTKTTALPEILRKRYSQLPLYVDFRWAKSVNPDQFSLQHPEFTKAIVKLAATIHGREPDEIQSQELRQYKRAIRTAWAGASLLAVLAILAAGFGYSAVQRQKRAERQQNLVLAQALAREALRLNAEQPEENERAALLAAHAYRLHERNKGTFPQAVEDAVRAVLSKPYFSVRLQTNANGLNSVSLSGDGRWLAAGSDDAIWLWDRQARGKAPLRVSAGPGGIRSVRFSPTGRVLAAGTSEGSILLWSLSEQGALTLTRSFEHARRRNVSSLGFDSTGDLLASSAGADVKVWKLQHPDTQPQVLCCHGDIVTAIEFAPDGHTVATGSADKTVRLWELLTAPPKQRQIYGHETAVQSLSFSRDGRYLASGTALEMSGSLLMAALSGNAVTIQGGTIWIRDLSTGTVRRLSSQKSTVSALSFNDDGRLLASGSPDRSVRLWTINPFRDSAIALSGHHGPISDVSFDRNGRLLVSAGKDSSLILWDMAGMRQVRRLEGHDSFVSALYLNANADTVLSVSQDGTLRVWRPAFTNALVRSVDYGKGAITAAAFPAESDLVVLGTEASLIEDSAVNGIWLARRGKPDSLQILARLSSAGQFVVAGSHGGIIAAASRYDRAITFYMKSELECRAARSGCFAARRTWDTRGRTITALAMNETGDTLVWASADGNVEVVSVTNATRIGNVQRAHGDITSLTVQPGRGFFFTGASDGTVTESALSQPAKTIRVFPGHGGQVTALASTRALLATGSSDRTVQVWELADASAQPVTFTAPWLIYTLAISSNGQWIAAAGESEVILWPILRDPVSLICSKVWRNLSERDEWLPLVGGAVVYEPTCDSLQQLTSSTEK